MIKLLKPTDYKKMMWKNKAGYTLEIARSKGEDLNDFDWRISMADIKTSGSFSLFHGMQRYLTVLEGHGILLNINNTTTHLNTLQTLGFSGDSQVYCELLSNQIRDFNLIYNPHKISAKYQWFNEQQVATLSAISDITFIFNQNLTPLDIRIDQCTYALDHQHSLLIQYESQVQSITLISTSTIKAGVIQLKEQIN